MDSRKHPDEAESGRRFRPDIEGLRAIAIVAVLLCHAGVPFLAGGYVGVDVFFVLSGFLITGILLAEFANRGRISLPSFYLRRARRILPAAALTLVVTDVAAHHLLNFVRAREAVNDSIWSALFAANVHFARQGSDYFAQGQPPSPFMHFWSLAVEEQFYFVWPSLLALLLALGLRRRLLAVLVAVAAGSFVWSVHVTAASPATAYYSTFARAWELALGAALAVAVPQLRRLPGRVGFACGWLGVLAIAYAGWAYSDSTPFPGSAALVPAAGAALVIGAGVAARRTAIGVGRVLALAPLRYLGDRSYAFYLWHWPVLILATEYAGRELPLGVRLGLLGFAFLLSVASYRFVENPVRRLKPTLRAGGLLWPATAAAVALVAVVILDSTDRTAARLEAAAAAVHPAQLVRASEPAKTKSLDAVVLAVRQAERGAPLPSPVTPSPSNLRGDFYMFPPGCSPGEGETSKKICRLGDARSSKTIVVIGDSHAQMWMPPVLRMASRDGWAVVPFVKPRCIPRSWRSKGECGKWYRWATRRASALRPDVTLVIGSWMAVWKPPRAIEPVGALATTMKRVSASVIVLGDVPGQKRDPTDCLLAPRATMATCTSEATRVQLSTNRAIASNAQKHGIGFVDTLGWFCAHARGSSTRYLCPLVVNKTVTCVDRGHISRTYGLELAPELRLAFRRQLFS
jgi:peptidoglycan/LPS O-acetylase OafA/YrhL